MKPRRFTPATGAEIKYMAIDPGMPGTSPVVTMFDDLTRTNSVGIVGMLPRPKPFDDLALRYPWFKFIAPFAASETQRLLSSVSEASFSAVDHGWLVPIDPDGQAIRVGK